MKNMKDLLKNKKVLMLAGGIILAIIILIIILVMIFNKKDEVKIVALEDKLKDYTMQFYKEHYFSREENREILEEYKDRGFNITITSLKTIVPFDEETESLLKEKNCDYSNSVIKIYPKEPYGEKDCTIKVELSCEK